MVRWRTEELSCRGRQPGISKLLADFFCGGRTMAKKKAAKKAAPKKAAAKKAAPKKKK
jgi:hypothetical protein